MIARSPERLADHRDVLGCAGIEAQFAPADVADPEALHDAIDKLVVTSGTPNVVLFNAVERVVGRTMSLSAESVLRAMSVSMLGALCRIGPTTVLIAQLAITSVMGCIWPCSRWAQSHGAEPPSTRTASPRLCGPWPRSRPARGLGNGSSPASCSRRPRAP